MIQLYFLSILCNGLSGYILFTGNKGEGADDSADSIEKSIRFSLNTPTFHLVLGILCAVTGILKLLSPTMDGILLLGDLVPSAAGIIAGIMLIFGIYRQDISAAPENPGALDRFGISLLRFRKAIGLGLIVVAFLHFLFPQALFL